MTFAEAHSAIAAARRSGRISAAAAHRLAAGIAGCWESFDVVQAHERITVPAGELADLHGLSGLDAIQLASAVALGPALVFAAWDGRLRNAALAEGLAVAPA